MAKKKSRKNDQPGTFFGGGMAAAFAALLLLYLCTGNGIFAFISVVPGILLLFWVGARLF